MAPYALWDEWRWLFGDWVSIWKIVLSWTNRYWSLILKSLAFRFTPADSPIRAVMRDVVIAWSDITIDIVNVDVLANVALRIRWVGIHYSNKLLWVFYGWCFSEVVCISYDAQHLIVSRHNSDILLLFSYVVWSQESVTFAWPRIAHTNRILKTGDSRLKCVMFWFSLDEYVVNGCRIVGCGPRQYLLNCFFISLLSAIEGCESMFNLCIFVNQIPVLDVEYSPGPGFGLLLSGLSAVGMTNDIKIV